MTKRTSAWGLVTATAAALLGAATTALAQPANDNCAAATAISGAGTYAFDTTGGTPDIGSTCPGNGSASVWFAYTATDTGTATVSTCGLAGFDTVLVAYTACDAATEIACNDDACGLQTTINFSITNGTVYLIRVSGFGAAAGAGSFMITQTGGGAIPNDNCGSATVVSEGSFPFSTIGANNDGTASCAASATSPDIWYSYTPALSGTATITTCDPSRNYDTALAIFDSCGGLELACNDDTGGTCGFGSTINFNVVGGTTYLIRVAGFAGGTGSSVLHINNITQAPPNDNCAMATAVGEGAFAFTTLGGTLDGFASCAPTSDSDVWFAYTATGTANARLTVTGATFASSTAAFDSCGGFELGCGVGAGVVTFPVTQGVTYFIRVGGNGAGQAGNGTLNIALAVPPANDLCENATVASVGANPFSTIAAGTEGSATCGFGGDPGSRDVFFSFMAPQTGLMTVTTCPGAGDTIVSVQDACGGQQLACNDDSAGGLCSTLFAAVTSGTTYIIRVANFGAGEASGDLTITVGDLPVGCLTAPPGAHLEAEVCGDDTNGGCNNPGLAVETIGANTVVFGTAWADSGTRDTDWYEFTLATDSLVTATLQTEFVGRLFILSNACPPTIIATTTTTACGPGVSLQQQLVAGTYRIFAGHNVFDGTPCVLEGQTHYILTVDSGAVGACCTDTGCIQTTASGCANAGGVFSGPGTGCGGLTYGSESNNETLLDITGTGFLAATASGCDDCGEIVPIGFPFNFFGTNFTDVGIASNGYLGFGGTPLGDFTNDPIPTAGTPNNIICPAWDDFNPGAQGDIFYQTDGAAPNRRFIVMWSNVAQFANTDSNTFQAILHEGSNRIEYRYGFMTEQVAGDITVGVENGTGTAGLNLDATVVIGPGNRAITVTNMVLGSPCSATGACCAPGGGCSILTQAACNAAGGAFQGDGSECGVATFELMVGGGSDFEDISGTGSLVTTTGDDALFAVNLGFPFSYYGTTYNTVNFCTNGNLQFPPSNSGAFTNVPIPNAAVPNGMIAPLWDDFNLNINTTDSMHQEVRGTAPNRRHIFQWTNVAQFGIATPDTDFNTFQAVLFEDGSIEFRYSSTLTDCSFEGIAGGPGATVGLEDQNGSSASVQHASGDSPVNPGSNIRANPIFLNNPCGADPCAAADFNGVDGINADDLSDFITCFFSESLFPGSCPEADFNGVDGVNADDLSDYITLYFGCV